MPPAPPEFRIFQLVDEKVVRGRENEFVMVQVKAVLEKKLLPIPFTLRFRLHQLTFI